MPLPFAPPPDESRVYDSLKSILLSDVTPDQLDSLRSTVFAQGTDGTEDEFRRLLLLGLASQQLSISGPIPNTGKIFTGTISGSGIGNITTVIEPNEGEVWVFQGAEGLWNTSPGASITFGMYIENTEQSLDCIIETYASTSTNPSIFDSDAQMSLFITYPNKLSFTVSSMGSAASCVVSSYAVRVR